MLFSDGGGWGWARLGAVSSTLVAFLMLMERSDSDRLKSTTREPPLKAMVRGIGLYRRWVGRWWWSWW